MPTFSAIDSGGFSHTCFDRTYKLRHQEDSVATLSFRSAFGTLATATSADGVWTFKRVGSGRPGRRSGPRGSRRIRSFEHDTWAGGGTLTLADGRAISVTSNFWQSKMEFRWSDDEVLFRYLTEGFLRQESELEVMPSLERMPEAPWLLLFGWYLVVMLHQDAAASAAIVS